MNKILIIFLTFFLFFGCSYKPILTNKQYDIQFSKIDFNGEIKLNNIIKNILSRRSNKESAKKYSIYFLTEQTKQIISSDAKGDPTIFKIEIALDYNIKLDEQIILSDRIIKQLTYNNISDKFELLKYEENLIKSLAEKMSNEILMSLTTL